MMRSEIYFAVKDSHWAAFLSTFLTLVLCVNTGFVEPPPSFALRTLAEGETRLPCHYQVEGEDKVVQVSWLKELPDGTKEHIITAHHTDGHKEFGRFSGRVRFENGSPTVNSALRLLSTEESDEGRYTCHISTFPSGNFERVISLTVWILPISTLEPVVLVEGQAFGVAASCRAVGRPAPLLSWDTELPGLVQNRSTPGGAVSTTFSLHPLRSMHGQRLDCLVWHPSIETPRRIPNRLEVQYPPDATISGRRDGSVDAASTGDWHQGMEGAQLRCASGGYPKPDNFTWTRSGSALPEGVSADGERLVFGRALRMSDSGVYQCVARNSVGSVKVEYTLDVGAVSPRKPEPQVDSLLIIIVGVAAGALIMIMVLIILLVNRHHRQKNLLLERQLSDKTEEMNSLSRQASLRRLNSVSTDPRVQSEDYALLRVDGRTKSSMLSLEDRPIYRGSQSALSGRRPVSGEVQLDYLGRPVLHQTTWRNGRESVRDPRMDGETQEGRERVESYLRTSHMSLDSGLPSSLLPFKPQQDHGVGTGEESYPENQADGGTQGADWAPTQTLPQMNEDDGNCSSHQISEALSNHFHYRNGLLRPKPHSNAILLNSKGHVI